VGREILPFRTQRLGGRCRDPGLYFNEVDKGGHFAAWEQPQLFSEEIRAAFKSLR
jgi:pimeloyl-ACP methyl ester carboxylesterase